MKKKFLIIGVAGSVAKRHLQAIKENSGVLVGSHDINDSVGIIDSYFPESKFFTDIDNVLKRLLKDGDIEEINSGNYIADNPLKITDI